MKKIVSLSPNITDILNNLGARDVIGHTNHYENNIGTRVGGWLTPSYDIVGELNPDIVFTSNQLQREISSDIEELGYKNVHLEPSSFFDIYDVIKRIGTETNTSENAEKLLREVKSRVSKVSGDINSENPIVYCEEWDSPPMVSGNWVPEMVRIVGGELPYICPEQSSQKMSQDAFKRNEPDVFISHVCGQGKMDKFRSHRPDWEYTGDVFFVDEKYLNQLSTKTLVGLEILSEIIYDADYGRSDLYNRVSYQKAISE